MFTTVLIANRGEIACRAIRTLKRLGVTSVAVYSDADRHAPHVSEADHAVALGATRPPTAICASTKFWRRRRKPARRRFIRLRLPVGERRVRRRLRRRRRGVYRPDGAANPRVRPQAPGAGTGGGGRGADDAGHRPAGGRGGGGQRGGAHRLSGDAEKHRRRGGIGLTRCDNEAALRAAYDGVKRLGEQFFRDAGAFLERFIDRARHVEVQIFGDGQGRVAALGERDCSLQRRNQKVVEETPAPHLPAATRQALHQAAVALGSRSATAAPERWSLSTTPSAMSSISWR
ncbi:2-oxoglutarate carboxylase small subunit [Serratia rubidaea]|uniref:2-oxoglutarate carboxylase small subunit n=1 Tax=Serratia rubidaea TaxID=61652 RepID=A0A3S4GM86_SERRU|nr:2-oxoglutarate carboxylase small subunit [Serratia rubidaea]